MSKKMYMSYVTPFDNGAGNANATWVPEVWSAEALMVLWNNFVMAPLVFSDYSEDIKESGDTVNVSQPAKFRANRTAETDNVTDQDAISTKVSVKLNQNLDCSFIIKDGEKSKSIKDLVRLYLEPAMMSIVTGVDNMLLAERYNFLANSVGKLGTAITRGGYTKIKTKMSKQLIPPNGRMLVMSPEMVEDVLNIGDFTNANTIGDAGSTLRSGDLGNLMGIRNIETNNLATIVDTDVTLGAVNNGAGYAAGATTVTVDGLSAAILAGTYFTVAGDMVPQKVVSTVGGATPTSIVFTPGLKSAVVDDAVVTLVTPYQVDLTAGYAVGTLSALVVDNRTNAASIGQLVSDGTAVYGVWQEPTTTAVELSRPTEVILADDAVLGVGPAGDYGFAFHRNAIALVSRPMEIPAAELGVAAATQELDGISVRVTMAYDQKARGTRVIVDVLCGVKTLDTNLGVVVLG